jgi:hypothetical protein
LAVRQRTAADRHNRSPSRSPLNVYPTNDGYVAINVAVGEHWHRLLAAMGREDLRDDPRFKTNAARVAHIGETDALVGRVDTDPQQDGSVHTGSHGGLLGGRPDTALKADALAALFNDAGIGIDEAGVTRLPALDKRGITAGTVAATSARIGDARSTYEDGILTRVNERAAALGIRPGMTVREFVETVRCAAAETRRNG